MEKKTLTVQQFLPSLTSEAYNKYFESSAEIYTESSQNIEVENISVELERNKEMEEPIEVKNFDLYLLDQISFFEEINKKHSPIQVFPNYENNEIIVSGEKTLRGKVKLEILQKVREITKKNLTDTNINASKLEFLKQYPVKKYVNEILKKEGHVCFIDGVEHIYLYYFQSGKAYYTFVDFINGLVLEKDLNIDEDTLIFIQTKQAEEFLDTQNDDSSLVSVVKQKRCITVVSVKEQFNYKLEAVEKFIRENKVHKAEILCSKEKQEFIKRFLSDKMKDVKNKIFELGVSLAQESTKFVLKGVKDDVSKGEKLLSELR